MTVRIENFQAASSAPGVRSNATRRAEKRVISLHSDPHHIGIDERRYNNQSKNQ